MTRTDCQAQAAGLTEPLRDLGFMLSCYDVYSGPPPAGCPGPAAGAPRKGDRP